MSTLTIGPEFKFKVARWQQDDVSSYDGCDQQWVSASIFSLHITKELIWAQY